MSSATFVVQSLHKRPGLVSLEEARRRPEIVYHSIRHLASPKKAAPTPTAVPIIPTINVAPATPTRAGRPIRTPPRPVFMMAAVRNAAPSRYPVALTFKAQAALDPRSDMTLVPLSVAAVRRDIKYRQEGFEMKERKVAAKNRKLHKRIFGSNVI
ncbi:hypothetical protein EIP86_004977 [Pleurotus ostreatoroseus]|nr:hypothetical protein EIP86_004977 [Pleurotus ostreatoroseus]